MGQNTFLLTEVRGSNPMIGSIGCGREEYTLREEQPVRESRPRRRRLPGPFAFERGTSYMPHPKRWAPCIGGFPAVTHPAVTVRVSSEK